MARNQRNDQKVINKPRNYDIMNNQNVGSRRIDNKFGNNHSDTNKTGIASMQQFGGDRNHN